MFDYHRSLNTHTRQSTCSLSVALCLCVSVCLSVCLSLSLSPSLFVSLSVSRSLFFLRIVTGANNAQLEEQFEETGRDPHRSNRDERAEGEYELLEECEGDLCRVNPWREVVEEPRQRVRHWLRVVVSRSTCGGWCSWVEQ